MIKKSLNLSYLILYTLLILYQLASCVYAFFPPLLGIYFCYLHVLLKDSKKHYNKLDFRWYFSLFYVLFIELCHNFYAFSALIAFFILHFYFTDWLKTNIKFGHFIIAIFIALAYFLSYLVDIFFSYLGHESYKTFGLIYLYFVLVESLIAYVLFKDKL